MQLKKIYGGLTIYKLVEKGPDYRIFKDRFLGIIPFYILEDSRKAVQKQGVWYDVKITNHYFKTLDQVKEYYIWKT
tara:strand:+ start:14299 stop:14526 length:228 start_codon:yes stop_codon:yes gene_type:complete